MNLTLKRPLILLAAGAALWAVAALPAHAALKHRYTFNDGTANDSVGTAHATVIDPGAPTAVFTTFGQIDLSANNGELSANPVEDAYIDLPNLIVQQASQSGVSGAYSFEFWFTMSVNRTWQRIGDFAGPRSDGAPSENVTNEGTVTYMLITPSSGRNNNGAEISNDVGSPGGLIGGGVLGLTGPTNPALLPNTQHHIVATYDKNNTSGGVNPGGTMALYVNGMPVLPGQPNVTGSNAIAENFDPNNLNDEDNWLGRSQWNDPLFDGSYNEFSIYDHALTPAEVTTNFNAGPVPVPLPTLIVNTVTGATAIKNLAAAAIDIDYYEITSPGGRLNAVTWNSLSDQNIDAGLSADFNNSNTVDGADLTILRNGFGVNATGDADGDGDTDGNDFVLWQRQLNQMAGAGDSWDEAAGVSDNLLVELFLNGSSTMGPNEQLNLGNAFRPGGAQDLTFRFAIKGEGSLTNGLVQYVTSGPAETVPEPMTTTLAVVAVLGLAAKRRRAAA